MLIINGSAEQHGSSKKFEVDRDRAAFFRYVVIALFVIVVLLIFDFAALKSAIK